MKRNASNKTTTIIPTIILGWNLLCKKWAKRFMLTSDYVKWKNKFYKLPKNSAEKN